jgi:hypothetical protein
MSLSSLVHDEVEREVLRALPKYVDRYLQDDARMFNMMLELCGAERGADLNKIAEQTLDRMMHSDDMKKLVLGTTESALQEGTLSVPFVEDTANAQMRADARILTLQQELQQQAVGIMSLTARLKVASERLETLHAQFALWTTQYPLNFQAPVNAISYSAGSRMAPGESRAFL